MSHSHQGLKAELSLDLLLYERESFSLSHLLPARCLRLFPCLSSYFWQGKQKIQKGDCFTIKKNETRKGKKGEKRNNSLALVKHLLSYCNITNITVTEASFILLVYFNRKATNVLPQGVSISRDLDSEGHLPSVSLSVVVSKSKKILILKLISLVDLGLCNLCSCHGMQNSLDFLR